MVLRRAIDPLELRTRGRRWSTLRLASLLAWLAFSVVVTLAHRAPWFPQLSGAPWSVGFFGLEVMDPLAVLAVVVGGGAGVAVLVAALPAAILVTLLGRFFCGWLCPYALLVHASDGLRSVLKKLGVPVLDLRIPVSTSFFVLGAALLASSVAGAPVVALIYPPAILGRAIFTLVTTGAAGASLAFVALAFSFDTFISRAGFCRSLCPGGALFSLVGARSPVSIERQPSLCTNCKACDIVCPEGLSPMTDATGKSCDRCTRCVNVCPTNALDLVAISRRQPRV